MIRALKKCCLGPNPTYCDVTVTSKTVMNLVGGECKFTMPNLWYHANSTLHQWSGAATNTENVLFWPKSDTLWCHCDVKYRHGSIWGDESRFPLLSYYTTPITPYFSDREQQQLLKHFKWCHFLLNSVNLWCKSNVTNRYGLLEMGFVYLAMFNLWYKTSRTLHQESGEQSQPE